MTRGRTTVVALVVAALAGGTVVALAAGLPVTSKRLTALTVAQGAPTTVPATPPSPTSLTLANRTTPTTGITGQIGLSDTITVTWSEPLSQASLCSGPSGWTTNLASRTLTNTVQMTIDNDGPANTGNDVLKVTGSPASCTGGFKFGTVDLGSPGFVTSTGSSFKDVPFNGSSVTVTSSATTTTVTITLGTPSTGGSIGDLQTVSSPVTAVYTPDGAIKDLDDNGATGTASKTAVQF